MLHQTEYKEIIVCLFDGGFDLGFAALANSLTKYNFKGLIYAGYRGNLPVWTKQLDSINSQSFSLNKDIVIEFVPVSTKMHLGYYKPYFLKQTFDDHPSVDKVYYFDTDILVKAPWYVFSKWLDDGVCLCLDNNFHYIHTKHPWRRDWRQLAGPDHTHYNDTDQYFNSGFMGIERKNIELINRWIHVTDKYIEIGGNIDAFLKNPTSSFKGDQDLLNAAVTVSSDIAINVMGKEAMGFSLPATIMFHAIGDLKPWNKQFLRDLLQNGKAPNMPDKIFFHFCKYPIAVFSAFEYKMKRLDLLVASFLGRFLG
jgi:hypothetical protein